MTAPAHSAVGLVSALHAAQTPNVEITKSVMLRESAFLQLQAVALIVNASVGKYAFQGHARIVLQLLNVTPIKYAITLEDVKTPQLAVEDLQLLAPH